MKKLLLTTILPALLVIIPLSAGAEVSVHVGIPLPPAIVFPFPPALVVIPETNVYAAPDREEDIFFFRGWWWRPWNGRWYRSRNYNGGWTHYKSVPAFYSRIPSTWREDYRGHRWKGHSWDYQRIPQHQVQDNWKGWEKSRHWESRNYWGVQGLRSRPETREIHQSRGPDTQQYGHQFRDDHPSREIEQRGHDHHFRQ